MGACTTMQSEWAEEQAGGAGRRRGQGEGGAPCSVSHTLPFPRGHCHARAQSGQERRSALERPRNTWRGRNTWLRCETRQGRIKARKNIFLSGSTCQNLQSCRAARAPYTCTPACASLNGRVLCQTGGSRCVPQLAAGITQDPDSPHAHSRFTWAPVRKVRIAHLAWPGSRAERESDPHGQWPCGASGWALINPRPSKT